MTAPHAKLRFKLLFLPAVAASAWMCGCGGSADSSNTSSRGGSGTPGPAGEAQSLEVSGGQVKKLTIGYNPTIAQPQVLVGLLKGGYAQKMAGVSVNGRVYDAGPAVLEALRSGVVQIACSGPFPALKAFAKEGDVVLLCGTASGGTQLMVSKNSPIKKVADLKGKIIGVNQLGSTVEAIVRYQVLKAGLKPEQDVKFVEVEPGEQAEAIKGGEVQAVAAPAPWPSQVQLNGNARALLDWKQIYNNGAYLSGSFFTTKKFAQENPEFIKSFLKATQEITDELNKDRQKSDAQVLDAWQMVTTKTLNPAVAKAAFSTIRYTTEASETGLQKFADINYELGLLRKKPDLKGFVWKP
jgi:NitT/TauT family transport system substrate-binding protein